MNTTITKFLLPLAALAMGSVACDPFPAKPGGDPAIVRVITYGGAGGASNTVETVTGGNTVSTDYAQPDDYIRVQFNKPMDGSTIQKYPQYNADGSTFVPPGGADPCTPADTFDVSSFPAGTLVCFDPSSATDGASAVIYPGALLALRHHLHRGRHRQGLRGQVAHPQRHRHRGRAAHPVRRGRVHHRRRLVRLRRRQLRGALVARPGRPAPTRRWPSSTRRWTATASSCEVLHHELVPHTDYWYQVKETTGATTITRPAAQGPASTLGALTPTLGVATTTTPPPDHHPRHHPGGLGLDPGRQRLPRGVVDGRRHHLDGGRHAHGHLADVLRSARRRPSTTAPPRRAGTLTSGDHLLRPRDPGLRQRLRGGEGQRGLEGGPVAG